MSGQDNNQKATELAQALQQFVDLMGETDVKSLFADVQSLKFDNERIVKPALKDIREILSRDIYAPKAEVAELKAEIVELKKALAESDKRTKNYEIVEKVVFGLVAVVLLAVVGAIVGLVVIQKG